MHKFDLAYRLGNLFKGAPFPLKPISVGALTLLVVACANNPLPPTSLLATQGLVPEDSTLKTIKSVAKTPVSPQQKLPASTWLVLRVNNSNELKALFTKHQLNGTHLAQFLNLRNFSRELQQLQSPQELRIKRRADGYVEAMTLNLKGGKILSITQNQNGFNEVIKPGANGIFSAEGSIHSLLDPHQQSLDLSEHIQSELVKIFRLDENLVFDVRVDDRFHVVYERRPNQEENVLAAEFTTRSGTSQAVRYINNRGEASYYRPNGDSLYPQDTGKLPSFRVPVNYTKVSSEFGTRRHPIIGRWLFHKGVDYTAPVGTPIEASAEGTIEFVGRKNGYGRTVILSHNEQCKTLYAHMSDYTQGLIEGNKVKQGEIIGYVGRSGFATGPHLHFEVQVDGIHQDPLLALAQALPTRSTIERVEVDKIDFHEKTRFALAELSKVSRLSPVGPATAQAKYVPKQLGMTSQETSPRQADEWLFMLPGYASDNIKPTNQPAE